MSAGRARRPIWRTGTSCRAPAFFPRARLNYAENLLRLRGEAPAIVFRREDGLRRVWPRDRLHEEASRISQALAAAGIEEGDRVAALLPNMPESVAVMAAAAALGAAFSSCSPDFGAAGVLDRFGQIEPRILFAVDGYKYAGRDHDIRAKLAEVASGLPTVETGRGHSLSRPTSRTLPPCRRRCRWRHSRAASRRAP